MSKLNLLPADLSMFDGAAAATGEANGSSSAAGESISGDTKAQAPAAGEAKTDKESRRKEFRELINGKYKAEHDEIFNRRFKENKQMEKYREETQPLIDMLHARYGTNGDNKALMNAFNGDSYFWSGVAEERGGTEETARKQLAMETELRAYKQREQVQKWNDEIAGIQEKYPDFDVEAEMQNPVTRRLLKSGVPLEHIYKLNHMDEVMGKAVETAVADTERRVTENIRAKGSRPDENGTQSSAGYVAKVDVSKLTREQRAEMAKKALRGETISF